MVAHEACPGIDRIVAFLHGTTYKGLVRPVIRAAQRALVPGQVLNRGMGDDPDCNIIVLFGDIIIFVLLDYIEVNRLQVIA
ncbi:hypothetical protein D3C73_1255890 [compost metagenome]